MALLDHIKHRPSIKLLLPRELRPGMHVSAEVVLEAKRRLEIDALDLRIEGEERVTYGSGQYTSYTRAPTMPVLSARLSARRVLERGPTRFPFRFDLPPNVAPSHKGAVAVIEYIASVHVDIDLWPDARRQFVIVVGPSIEGVASGRPRLYSTAPDGPRGPDAELDLSLASDAVSVGDALVGTVAVAHGGASHVREIALAFVGSETRLHEGSERGTFEAQRYVLRMPMPESGSVDFRIKIPEDASVSLDSRLFRMSWALELTSKVSRGHAPTLRVPIRVLPRGITSVGRSVYAPPVLGDERVQKQWTATAAKLGMTLDEDVLAKQVDDVRVEVRRELRGRHGVWLVARLAYPSLELDLDGGTASSFRRVVGGGVTVGQKDWDRDHYLTGREAAQIEGFVRALPAAFFAFQLEDVDDEHLVLSVRGGGERTHEIDAIARAALDLAGAIANARRAIPPPRAMKDAVAAWKDLARRLGGELETARMAVQGTLDGASCAVVTDWTVDGDPHATRVEVHPDPPVDDKRFFRWEDGALHAADPTRLGKDVLALLARLDPTLPVRADAYAVLAELPAPLIDPKPALDLLHTLQNLTALLQGRTGPYR